MTQLMLNVSPMPMVIQLGNAAKEHRQAQGWCGGITQIWSRNVEFTAPLSRMLNLLGQANETKKNTLVGSYLIGEKWWYYATRANYNRLPPEKVTTELALLCKYSSLHETVDKFEHRWYAKAYSSEAKNDELIKTLLSHIKYHVPEAVFNNVELTTEI
jgi:hypothetical protein